MDHDSYVEDLKEAADDQQRETQRTNELQLADARHTQQVTLHALTIQTREWGIGTLVREFHVD